MSYGLDAGVVDTHGQVVLLDEGLKGVEMIECRCSSGVLRGKGARQNSQPQAVF